MASFTVKLDDQVSQPAKKASQGADQLAGSLTKLAGASTKAGEALKKGAAPGIEGTKGRIAGLKDQLGDLGKLDFSNSWDKLDTGKLKKGLGELSKETIKSKIEGADLLKKNQGLAGSLQQLAPYAIAASVALDRLKRAASFLADLVVSGMRLAISLYEQKGALRDYYAVIAGGSKGADRLLQGVSKLAEKLPFAKDQVNKWARALADGQVPAAQLVGRTHAVAAAMAIMGESGASAAQGLFTSWAQLARVRGAVVIDRGLLDQLRSIGLTSQDLAKMLGVPEKRLLGMKFTAQSFGDAVQRALIDKGVGPLKRLGMTWEAISTKFHEGIASAFEGLDDVINPFMTALQDILGEFSKGKPAANDFKSVVQGVFRSIFTAGTKALTAIHIGLLTAQIEFTKARIAAKPFTDVLGRVANFLGMSGDNVLLGALKALAVVAVVLAAALTIALLPLIMLGAAALVTGYVVYSALGLILKGVSFLAGLGIAALQAGQDLIAGLVKSIVGGASWVVEAIENLATSAITAFKRKLGIASPSRVMMQMGVYTTQGLAGGLQSGVPMVSNAAAGTGAAVVGGVVMGAQAAANDNRGRVADTMQPGAQQVRAQRDGRTIIVNVQPGAIVIQGAGGDARELTEEAVGALFERVALQLGADGDDEEAAA